MLNHMLFALPGGWEFFVVLFLVLLLFGGRKIPELARGIGKGIREFNSARASVEDEIKKGLEEDEKKELERLRKEKAERQKIEEGEN